MALAAPVFWTASIAVILVLAFDLFKIDVVGQPHIWEQPIAALKWYLIPMFAGGARVDGEHDAASSLADA